jgi:hypothetical protein
MKRWFTRCWTLACAAALCALLLPAQASAAGGVTVRLASLGAPGTLVACIDDTASVGPLIVGPAKALLARELRGAVRPGFRGLVVHIRKIGRESWSPGAELLSFVLPPVHAYPAQPRIGFFASSATKRAAHAAYQAALERVRGEQSRAQAALEAGLKKIAALRLPTEHGTDLAGCAAKVPDLTVSAGPVYLTLFSDLSPQGPQTNLAPVLGARTQVTVVLYCAAAGSGDRANSGDTAAGCRARTATFRRAMTRAGARRVTVYDLATVAYIPATLYAG